MGVPSAFFRAWNTEFLFELQLGGVRFRFFFSLACRRNGGNRQQPATCNIRLAPTVVPPGPQDLEMEEEVHS